MDGGSKEQEEEEEGDKQKERGEPIADLDIGENEKTDREPQTDGMVWWNLSTWSRPSHPMLGCWFTVV